MHAYPMVDPPKGWEKYEPAEQAKIAEYRDPDTSECYIPGVAIQRCLVGAAAYSKGKGRASLQKQVAACVLVTPERCSLGTKEYTVDSRPVVIPATKGRIVRHRPRFDQWQCAFTIEYDTALLNETELRQVIDDAGSRVGLLDFRPEKKGPFGRFIVVEWKS
jgi:copper chaperone CopZ